MIALRAGGAVETLTDETALFFEAQTVDALEDALRRAGELGLLRGMETQINADEHGLFKD